MCIWDQGNTKSCHSKTNKLSHETAYYFMCVNLHVLLSSQSLYKSRGGLKGNNVDKCWQIGLLMAQVTSGLGYWDIQDWELGKKN